MEKITCDLKHCYGINKLQYEFDFTNTNAISVYARNGLMKTSFAKTFKKIQDGKAKDVKDEIFDLSATVDVKVDGRDISSQDVFVIKSFEDYYVSDSVAALLIDDEVKTRIATVLKLKDRFLKSMEKHSGLKVSKTSLGKKVYELEPQMVDDFQFVEDSFLLNVPALGKMEMDVVFSGVRYCDVFDSTVMKKILSQEFQEKIKEFSLASDEIYHEYKFLEKGKFTLPKLKNILKSLDNDKFFVKNNYIYLDGETEIKAPEELKGKILQIEERIKRVPEFQEIEKMLSDSKGTILKDILENHPDIIAFLHRDKLGELKKRLWLSYISLEKGTFEELLSEYVRLESEIADIDLDATSWKKALDIFEERFTVPYKMSISNIKGAIIGESVPRIEFEFKKGEKTVKMDRGQLENADVLSQGEKRALYLLNIIFDIEKIKESNREVLFIVDDIADSFDYKNKYAIIEYLYEMSINSNFRLIILSHNFDFFRTVSMRLSLNRQDRLSVEMLNDQVILKEEKYQKQPFMVWKTKLNLYNIIALIPFVRNMIEYGQDKNIGGITGIEEDYILLTHLLHEKNKTNEITFNTLKKVYKSYLGKDDFQEDIDLNELVIKKIYDAADGITLGDTQLEHKIILAIAIRHKAEEYMLKELSGYTGQLTWKVKHNMTIGTVDNFMTYLNTASNQTRELFNAFKQLGYREKNKLLEEVNIMTPENIHLNSFMYEPILDMDINELLNLYQKVKEI